MAPRKKAGANCCVVGCKNNTLNSPGTRFYVFSQVYFKKAQTEKWIAAVQRKNSDGSPWEPKKYTRICSQHFIGNKKSDHPLSPSFAPTIFPAIGQNVRKIKNLANSTVARFEHSLARSNLQESPHHQLMPVSRELISGARRPRFLQRHRRTQVDFLETPLMDCKIFICNRYVNGGVSEAETQACIPRIRDPLGKANRRNVEFYSGNNCIYRDRAVGPDSTNLRKKSLSNLASSFHGFTSITSDREMIEFGGVTLKTFDRLLKILEGSDRSLKISRDNELLIFLSKIKLGLTFSALSFLFNVERITISRAFHRTLKFLSQACKNFVVWPSREVVQLTMPKSLKKRYKNCRVVVNSTEIEVERPRDREQRLQLYSNKRKTFTVKVLVGCTPNGLISFISKCYDGRTSDARIESNSGFLDLLEPGDIVIAAKGAPEIRTAVTVNEKAILLAMQRCLSNNNNFSIAETKETDIVASVRIQTARTLQRIKSFGILSKLTVNMLPFADDILFMCCVLANLQSEIIKI